MDGFIGLVAQNDIRSSSSWLHHRCSPVAAHVQESSAWRTRSTSSFLWRASRRRTSPRGAPTPPPFLDDYKRVDESYESLVYEANVTTAFTKVATFGMGKTLYRLRSRSAPVDGTDAA